MRTEDQQPKEQSRATKIEQTGGNRAIQIGQIFGNVFLPKDHSGISEKERTKLRKKILHVIQKKYIAKYDSSLNSIYKMHLVFSSRPEAVVPKFSYNEETPYNNVLGSQPNIDVWKLFEEEEQDSLLILGSPGSGKTTTLIDLARQLAARASTDEIKYEQVPLYLKLSLWSHDRKSFEEWVIDMLDTEYGVSKKYPVKEWLSTEPFVLLLDGLDEIDPRNRSRCVDEINRFHKDNSLTKVVVSSRDDEYLRFHAMRLNLEYAVEIQPLSVSYIKQYLVYTGLDYPILLTEIDQD
jgi:predicted NACHT family NTPase